MSDIGQRASFDFIRYSNCWEDAEVLLAGLNSQPGAQLLSIASAGDNTFSLLTSSPTLVVAVDLNPAQIALVELKAAAFKTLEYETMLAFLGFSATGKDSRADVYGLLRNSLPERSRGFWNAHPDLIQRGVIHTGKFERYFSVFRRKVLPFVHGRAKVKQLIQEKSKGEREHFYNTTWDTFRWRLMFQFFFSRFVMGRLGRDPELFRYVKGSVAERILQRTRHALTAIPTHSNPYVQYILTGSFGKALPHYARQENFAAIQNNLGALHVIQGTTDDALKQVPNGYHGMNLSDIFEYMTPEVTAEVSRTLIAASEPEARLVYWNMLAPRDLSAILPKEVSARKETAQRLFAEDRAFFYQALHIDEVR